VQREGSLLSWVWSERTPGSAMRSRTGPGVFTLCLSRDPSSIKGSLFTRHSAPRVCPRQRCELCPKVHSAPLPNLKLPEREDEGKGTVASGGEKWLVRGGSRRTYQESRCRGRAGSGYCCQHRHPALEQAPHSAGSGSGLHPQCRHPTQTMVTNLLWVVSWDGVKCLRTPSGDQRLHDAPQPGQMHPVPGQACVAHRASSVCSPRQMSSPGEGAGLVQERVR
jgi:hypothetical protein